MKRSLPVGAEVTGPDQTHFRVWAPNARRVELVLVAEQERIELAAEKDGYFSGTAEVGAGARYAFSLDGAEPRPDPASRFQPEGPHAPSEVIDPGAYVWRDTDWTGPAFQRSVIYELHVGTFTPEGTWAAARQLLPTLKDIGIDVIELMPVATFPGRFGWGYDGVDIFAPAALYGTPDELRGFVDAAHDLGIAVLLDVVYNHFGPDGCYLSEFAEQYFSSAFRTEWGEALNFDGEQCGPVREFILANAHHWIAEYHLDGLRLDATQSMFDDSEPHIVAEIAAVVRRAAGARRTLVIAENEPQEADLLRPVDVGGYGLDAAWNDDFHHSAMVALTGRSPAYYSDYRGTAQELLSATRRGYLYQGQYYRWQKKRRGSPALDLETRSFVNFLQNHDQVANSARGLRISELSSPSRLRAMTALLLLAPGTPMLFQGQEFGSSSPFLYFADHKPDLAARVREGRREFLTQFPEIATPAMAALLPDPAREESFRSCVLDHGERERNAHVVKLHRDLIALSRTEPFRSASRERTEGAVLAERCLLLRYFGAAGDDRLLIVNLGSEFQLAPLAEPLLAPPAGAVWQLAWSSEEPQYFGNGAPADVEAEPGWYVPADAALVLRPEPRADVRGS